MAFTVTTSATRIDITSGTGNLTDLETAVNDAGIFTSTGQVFSVVGNRELEISSGVTLNTTDGDTLQWNLTANVTPVIDLTPGGIFNVAQNTTIDADTNSTHQGRVYLYGTVTCSGTAGNLIYWQNFSYMYWWFGDTTPWVWDYVTIRNITVSTGFMPYLVPKATSGNDGEGLAHSFTNITVSDDGGFGIPHFMRGDFSSWTFDSWTFSGLEEIVFSGVQGLKFSNSTFINSDDYIRFYNNGVRSMYSQIHTSKTKSFSVAAENQPFLVFDTCTFDDMDTGVYGMYVLCANTILLKDCTFQNQTNPVRNDDSHIMLYGTNTIASKQWIAGGTYLYVRKLDLTVVDADGSPIENATVRIRTKLEKTVGTRDFPYEEYCFLTDENGQVKGAVEDSIYLTEKEETSAGVYTQWSDGVSNNVHIIEIIKTGYATNTSEVAMTEDRTVSKTLSENNQTIIQGATTIQGTSTIY